MNLKDHILFLSVLALVMCEDFTAGARWTSYSISEDCLELYKKGYTEDGVYTIMPPGQTAVEAWCDMLDGGWTVVQRRQDGSEDFYRGWTDYVTGFGNKNGKYWLGLDNIHALTSKQSEAAINNPQSANLTFASFVVDDASYKYKLHIKWYNSTCNNFREYGARENGMEFSTYNKDNDNSIGKHCARIYTGGWWYDNCFEININGQFLKGLRYLPCWRSEPMLPII